MKTSIVGRFEDSKSTKLTRFLSHCGKFPIVKLNLFNLKMWGFVSFLHVEGETKKVFTLI